MYKLYAHSMNKPKFNEEKNNTNNTLTIKASHFQLEERLVNLVSRRECFVGLSILLVNGLQPHLGDSWVSGPAAGNSSKWEKKNLKFHIIFQCSKILNSQQCIVIILLNK